MKRFLNLVTLSSLFISSVSMASVARIAALQSNHLIDPEYVYLFPTKLLELNDYILIRTGTTLSTDPYRRPAVAGKISIGDQNSDHYAVGVTLGRQNDLVDYTRQLFNAQAATNYEYSSNAVNLNYALRDQGRSYSVGFFYANQQDKVNQKGNEAGTMNLGLRIDDFTLGATVGLFNTVDASSIDHLSINQAFSGALVYELDDIHFILDVSSSRTKKTISNAQTNSYEFLDYKMGLVKNTFNGHEIFFYRINLETSQVKNRVAESVSKEVRLPLTLGVETNMTDEIKLRSSVKQIVGIYQSDDFSAGKNTTTAAVGLGFKFNKIVIDGVLQGLVGTTATQQINANQFLSEASVTYWF